MGPNLILQAHPNFFTLYFFPLSLFFSSNSLSLFWHWRRRLGQQQRKVQFAYMLTACLKVWGYDMTSMTKWWCDSSISNSFAPVFGFTKVKWRQQPPNSFPCTLLLYVEIKKALQLCCTMKQLLRLWLNSHNKGKRSSQWQFVRDWSECTSLRNTEIAPERSPRYESIHFTWDGCKQVLIWSTVWVKGRSGVIWG